MADGVAFATLDPPDPRATCVAFQGYGAWLDSFELQRYATIAAVTAARVVVIETPGIGTAGTRLSRPERIAALRGDYAPLAGRMVRAAREHGARGNGPVHLLGYSLGASLATAAAAAVEGFRSLTLVEPVGLERVGPLRLARATRAEDTQLVTYLDETAAIAGAVAPTARPPRQGGLDRVALPWGLTRGLLSMRIGSLPPSLSLTVIRGDRSLICDAGGVSRLEGRARVRLVPGSHALWHSLPRVVALAQGWAMEWDDV